MTLAMAFIFYEGRLETAFIVMVGAVQLGKRLCHINRCEIRTPCFPFCSVVWYCREYQVSLKFPKSLCEVFSISSYHFKYPCFSVSNLPHNPSLSDFGDAFLPRLIFLYCPLLPLRYELAYWVSCFSSSCYSYFAVHNPIPLHLQYLTVNKLQCYAFYTHNAGLGFQFST
ncbi:hypothetical protein L211DRAFT_697527 [Terfezia boudieri ATCC MYA-4762]|uniref:Uncharacterized protein n=1 Tax=Terfezia boudieri ATCC MYA-4762 TaxID=1051890 RepID=A0A3N4LWR3_9PEZI|nr:hypothetical protein L211DRAFT_697527 [Terfezia boudieri ATCC MYA-4762]